jgi:hypothetical protein
VPAAAAAAVAAAGVVGALDALVSMAAAPAPVPAAGADMATRERGSGAEEGGDAERATHGGACSARGRECMRVHSE